MPERTIDKSVFIPAPLAKVWDAWTTEEGLKFFAPACNIDIRPDGPYEIFFMPEAEPGMRGADGMRVLAVEHHKMLSFSWNAPPSLPEVRGQRTVVILRFSEAPGGTQLTLAHLGWGSGGQWPDTFRVLRQGMGRNSVARTGGGAVQVAAPGRDRLPFLTPAYRVAPNFRHREHAPADDGMTSRSHAPPRLAAHSHGWMRIPPSSGAPPDASICLSQWSCSCLCVALAGGGVVLRRRQQ